MVVDEALYGDVIPVVSNEILAEYKEVLSRPKFQFSDEMVASFLDNLKARAAFVKFRRDVLMGAVDVSNMFAVVKGAS